MKDKKRVYLIDFDNTLFDTDKLKDSIGKEFAKKYGQDKLILLWEVYDKSAEKLKYVDIKAISEEISKKLKIDSAKDIENIFLKADFPKFTFKHTHTLISILQKKGKVILYSLGDMLYQPVKIRGSGIEGLIGKNSVIISGNKTNGISSLVLDLKSKGYAEIFVIDDRADFLETAKITDQNLTTIWYKHGKYKKILPENKLSIDFEVNTGNILIQYLELFAAKLLQNPLKENISVINGIFENQIKEIIFYTRHDKEIRKYTGDNERFASRKSFDSWRVKGKNIYTMCSSRGNILGIIWFANKKPPKIIRKSLKNHTSVTTFAIRLYPTARHKGLAAKFMNECFKDFCKNRTKTIWLSTRIDNNAAINLYERFGFVKIKTTKNQLFYRFTT